MVNELFDMAGQHDMIAENLNVVVMSELLRNIQDLKQDRKKVRQSFSFLLELQFFSFVFVQVCICIRFSCWVEH